MPEFLPQWPNQRKAKAKIVEAPTPIPFRPYVPPPLPLDVQRRIDEFRAVPSLYK